MYKKWHHFRNHVLKIISVMITVSFLLSVPAGRILADTVSETASETTVSESTVSESAASESTVSESTVSESATSEATEQDAVTELQTDAAAEDNAADSASIQTEEEAEDLTAAEQDNLAADETDDLTPSEEEVQTESNESEQTEDEEDSDTATIWIVGDSTLAENHTTNYYMARVGYGVVLKDYFNATVYNLAVCGSSSRSFKDLSNYNTLINGSDTVPALGNASGKKYLIIGFGHNDTTNDSVHYTDPSGDYQTSGSFANYLYTYYVKPALDAGVIPVLCTPIVRWTNNNTLSGYNGYYGHVTSAGDYPQAIRDLAKAMGSKVILLDLTEESKNLNILMGTDAKMLHAYSGAEFDQTTCTVNPTGIDITHTNLFGANMNAWLLTQLCKGTSLAAFSKNKSRPKQEKFLTKSINSDYKIANSTGLFKGQDDTWRYYANGTFDDSYEGMARDVQYNWYYVKNGLIDDTYTGMAHNQWGWWYINNGKLDMTYTGMAHNQWGWWYIRNGKLDLTYTGMAHNQWGWWYMTNGKLDLTYTGMAHNQWGWWYMTKGKLNTTFTGIGKNAYGRWYFKNGKLQADFTGYIRINGKYYRIKKGKVS